MKNETAMPAPTNPWLDYGLDDLFYALEEAEDGGKEAKAEAIRQAIDALVA